ncbi:hypothetical protein [Streptomyces graminilatus]|uniref:hypothetical protein n=1 Tax=Streptomyces graminilatus TaxID=1464070 RepID=UPI0006E415AB|nr:hypothetical protein [Streptomyces graminilatus]
MNILTQAAPAAPTLSASPTALHPDPIEAFNALVAEYGLQVEEWDTSTLDEPLRDKLLAHYLEQDGTRLFVVPLGQDPAVRLAALHTLLNHQGVMPV